MQPEIVGTASHVVYRNRWMTVREDTVRRANGEEGIYGIVEKPDFAVIAAIDEERIYLVQQFRYPVAGRYWELPQGSWEQADVDPARLAASELREETGLEAASMTHVGHLFLAYGYSTQGYDVFVARHLKQLDPRMDAEEHGLVARAFDLRTVEEMIATGLIKDATTVAAFGLLRLKRLL